MAKWLHIALVIALAFGAGVARPCCCLAASASSEATAEASSCPACVTHAEAPLPRGEAAVSAAMGHHACNGCCSVAPVPADTDPAPMAVPSGISGLDYLPAMAALQPLATAGPAVCPPAPPLARGVPLYESLCIQRC